MRLDSNSLCAPALKKSAALGLGKGSGFLYQQKELIQARESI